MRRFLLMALSLLFASGPVEAAWPERPVQVIVPYSPGAATDIMARALADGLTEILGQSFIVVNRDGASATIGTTAVAQARPDGYTIGFTAVGPITIQPLLMQGLPYKPDSFTPVCQTVDLVFALAVRQDSRFKNLKDVIEAARASPGKVSYGLTGTYTIPHFNLIDLEISQGIKLLHSPYRGDAPTTQALQSGEVDMAVIGIGASMSQNLRPIGLFGPSRATEAPDIPTFTEQGYPLAHTVVAGLIGPKGMPADIAARLEAACAKAIATERYLSLARSSRLPPAYLNAADFGRKIADDLKRNTELAAKAGIKSQSQ